jgi:aspartyl-tRNA(Asn)/glutamyl-tRNA(Gln) amidotransferase subunit C
MMNKPDFDIKYIANLARIELTDEEEDLIGRQLSQILDYIEKLKQVDITGIEPTAHANPLVNVSRPDIVVGSLSKEEALMNAPQAANNLFIVPKIVE